MENKITGKSPQPITDEDTITFEDNLPAQELCEQVDLFTKEAREGLLQKALAISSEQCKVLISRQNALIEELTQQVRSVKWSANDLEWNLKDDNEKLMKDLRQSNNNLLESLRVTIRQITEVATQIQTEVSIATARTTDEASAKFNKRINEAADKAIAKIDELANEITKKAKDASKEIDGAKDDIHFERSFRKFFFWATPILLVAQAIVSVFLLLK